MLLVSSKKRGVPRVSSRWFLEVGLVILLMFVGFVSILTYGPSFTGLAGVVDQSETLVLTQVFTSTATIAVQFSEIPTSVAASGSVTGQGTAVIRLLSGTSSYLIATLSVDGQQSFTDLCVDSCSVVLSSTDAIIDVELTGTAQVTLDTLDYTFSSTNTAPVWVGKTTTFTLRVNQPLTLELSGYVIDDDGDELTFVVTASDSFSIDLVVDQLTITPAQDFIGDEEIVLYVSDATETLRVPLSLTIQQVTTFELESLNVPGEVATELVTELELYDEVDVFVVLREKPAMNPPLFVTSSTEDKRTFLEKRKEAINSQTTLVLHKLKLGTYYGRGVRGKVFAAQSATNSIDFRLKQAYGTVPAFSGRITKKGYQKLINDPRVLRIVKDLPVKLNTNISVARIRAALVRNMTLQGISLNGSGYSACIIDSGIDNDHPDFGNRILNETCFCSASDLGNGGCCSPGNTITAANATDDYGHGTLAAAIIASQNATFLGVAPGAGIVAVKAFNSSGDALFSDIATALDHCISNSTLFNITTISMSFGTNLIGTVGSTFDASSAGFSNADVCDNLSSSVGAVTTQLNLAAGLGIIPVASTGNNGFITGISYPACVTNVTAVSAVNSSTDDIPSFSNSIDLHDVWAPGVSICGARGNESNNLSANAGFNCDDAVADSHISSNGTSFAAPHVAGAIIILRQIVDRESLPNLTIPQVKELLNESDVFVKDPFNNVNRPRLSLINMVARLARNYTLNVTAGTVRQRDFGFVNYSTAPDFTQVLDCLNVSYNFIGVNDSNNCQELNASARLILFDVENLTNPRVFRNGAPCTTTFCSDIRYNGSALFFTVTSFSNYTANDSLEHITTCRLLNTSGTHYLLNTTVTSNATCFTVGADDITLDCNSSVIQYGLNGSDGANAVTVYGIINRIKL